LREGVMTERAGLAVAGGAVRRPRPPALGRLAISLVAVLALAACSSDATPSTSEPVALTPIPVPASVAPAGSPTATPTPKPSPKPTPAKWTSPTLVSSEGCYSLRGGIDAAGRSHVAASCGNRLLYSVTKSDASWTQTLFPLPDNRIERDPQIAFQGNVAYLAYSRVATGEGDTCGPENSTDIGAFYRKRTQPSGGWSDPVRIGRSDDHLVQFRVDGSTLHAIVQREGDTRFSYLLIKETTSRRYLLPSTPDPPSLRVGNDGRARIAYVATGSIRIATFTGSGFSTVKVPSVDSHTPLLVLDSRDHAHLVWMRDAAVYGEGCGDGEPDSNRGVFYATNATGSWRSERLTHEFGSASFQVDRATGQVHMVMASQDELTYYTKPSGGTWQNEKLPPRQAGSPVIARDPTTGRLLILYLDYGGSGIYAMSKGG
jgi:hypothetical protein